MFGQRHAVMSCCIHLDQCALFLPRLYIIDATGLSSYWLVSVLRSSVPSVPQSEVRTPLAQLLLLRISYLIRKQMPQVGGRLSWSDNWFISILHWHFQESQNGALLRLYQGPWDHIGIIVVTVFNNFHDHMFVLMSNNMRSTGILHEHQVYRLITRSSNTSAIPATSHGM